MERPRDATNAHADHQRGTRSGHHGHPSGAREPGPFGRRIRDVAAWGAMSASRRPPAFRIALALASFLLGSALLLGAARADEYLHRGIESGDEIPPVRHLAGRELGINADLRDVAPDMLDTVIAGLSEEGIRYVRQPLTWSSIESEPDSYDWSAYDLIVQALDAQGIALIAVIGDAPEWTSSADGNISLASPPEDMQDLGIFIDALMDRYTGQIPYLQVWHRPNLASYWGGQNPDPSVYAEMLAAAASAARQRDGSVSILTAELAAGDGDESTGEAVFLRALYRAGAGSSFDAVALEMPGGTASPFDRWVDADRLTMSRAILIREAMIDAGDRETPVWATSYPVTGSTASNSPPARSEFVIGGMLRARSEWPWLGPIIVGDTVVGDGGMDGSAESLLGEAGLTPRLESLLPIATRFAGSAAPGVIPSGAPAIAYEGEWSDQAIGETTFRTTTEQGASVEVRFEGTGVAAVLRRAPTAGAVRITLDGAPLPGTVPVDGVTILPLFRFAAEDSTLPIATGLEDTEHTLTIELNADETSAGAQVDLTFGGIIVSRTRPADWPVAVIAAVGVVALWYAVRETLFVLATWAGWLRRHRELDLGPPLSERDVYGRG